MQNNKYKIENLIAKFRKDLNNGSDKDIGDYIPCNAGILLSYVENDVLNADKHGLSRGVDLDINSDPKKTFKAIQDNIADWLMVEVFRFVKQTENS